MKGIEIRDFCGDYALDIPMGEGCVHTIYFNSYRNAKTVKRIMEIDDSIPNAATVCDMVEVVRCKDCAYYREENGYCMNPHCGKSYYGCPVRENHYCSFGERKEQT